MLGLDPELAAASSSASSSPPPIRAAGVGRRLRPIGAVRRRAAVPARPRGRQLLRRRRLPRPLSRRATGRGPVRLRVPRLRERPRRGCDRDLLVPEPPSERVVHNPRWKAGRAARRRLAAGTSTTCATTTSKSLFGGRPGRASQREPDRYLELSRAVTGEVMAEVFGEWRRAGSPCGRGPDPVAPRPRPRRRLGTSSTIAAAQDRLSPPAPGPRAGRRLDDRRRPRWRRRARRQRPARAAARAAARGALTAISSCLDEASRGRRSVLPRTRPPSATSRPCHRALRRRGSGPTASGRPRRT